MTRLRFSAERIRRLASSDPARDWVADQSSPGVRTLASFSRVSDYLVRPSANSLRHLPTITELLCLPWLATEGWTFRCGNRLTAHE